MSVIHAYRNKKELQAGISSHLISACRPSKGVVRRGELIIIIKMATESILQTDSQEPDLHARTRGGASSASQWTSTTRSQDSVVSHPLMILCSETAQNIARSKSDRRLGWSPGRSSRLSHSQYSVAQSKSQSGTRPSPFFFCFLGLVPTDYGGVGLLLLVLVLRSSPAFTSTSTFPAQPPLFSFSGDWDWVF
ncbi:hypothetical protein P170DRAFT_161037 [Aspergillus steynii IBT 23096]|uniref:Uncharacterized protein n=1 Tax=Aspergillus steynii IBT 23096 TaxID=1392250 RepID=A0A2I2GE60_9EURO|nr:uncharacterized protein P170DRAFT_161037 [Aspergillus steynii IBT 23096]PLB51142.1 hypothetical protein P170DRAFT_161037 [Aspergillus steynii IBT 23096]